MSFRLPDAPTVAAAYLHTLRAFVGALPGAFLHGPAGAPTAFCGLELPNFNTVTALDPVEATPAVLAAGVSRLAKAGVPHSLSARPACDAAAELAAAETGLVASLENPPLMTIVAPPAAPRTPALLIRQLPADAPARHSELAGAAFCCRATLPRHRPAASWSSARWLCLDGSISSSTMPQSKP